MPRRTPKVQKVQIVPKRKKRSGPKITSILKNKTVAKLMYVDTVTIDPGAAAIAKHTFLANGLFDPDNTGTGHQSLMRDTYSDLYSTYRVLSSSLRVTPVATTNANNVPGLWGVYLDVNTSLDFSLATAVIEDKRNKTKWGMTIGNTSGANVSGNAKLNALVATFKGSRDLSPEGAHNTVLISQDPAANTEFSRFFHIWYGSIAGNNPGAATFLVELSHVVEYTGPKHLLQS